MQSMAYGFGVFVVACPSSRVTISTAFGAGIGDPAGAAVELFAAGGEAVNCEGGDDGFELLRLVEVYWRSGSTTVVLLHCVYKVARGEKSALVIRSILE